MMLQSPNQQVFTGTEEADFDYIWKRLDRKELVAIVRMGQDDQNPGQQKELGRHVFLVHMQTLVPRIDTLMREEFEWHRLSSYLYEQFKDSLPSVKQIAQSTGLYIRGLQVIHDELLMYGLLQQTSKMESPFRGLNLGTPQSLELRTHFVLIFTNKMYRFKYWLAYHGWLPEALRWELDTTAVTDPI